MKKVIFYLISVILLLAYLWAQGPLGNIPSWLIEYHLGINCIIISSLAGVLYCVRAVYVNYCVNDKWEARWEVWYYLRPLASALAGFVAFIFLNASIVVLEASQSVGSANYGYFLLSFIAGYNVDKFLKKIEDLAQSTFGVEKSRAYGQDQPR